MKILRTIFAAALLACFAAIAPQAGAQTAVYNTTAPVLTDRQQSELQADASGNLKVTTSGNVAAGAADSGNPVKIGGVAYSNNTPPNYGDGLRSNITTALNGALFIAAPVYDGGSGADGRALQGVGRRDTATWATSPNPLAAGTFVYNGATWDRARGDTNGMAVQPAMSANFWSYAAATGGIVNTVTAVTIKTAAGASVRNYVCSLNYGHDTLGAATELAIRDGAAGTVLWRGKLQTAAREGDSEVTFHPCLKGTANTLVEVVTLTAVTGGVFVNVQGYTGQ